MIATLRGKTVAVVGLERSGVAVVKALLARGARVFATEAKPLEELSEKTRELCRADMPDLQFSLGDPAHAGIEPCELVIISPGVRPDIEPLQRARAQGAEVIGEIELAYRLCPTTNLIAITGTKGKTTTTVLTGAMLSAAGIPHIVCGNIGLPFIGAIDRMSPPHWVALEVSSFQLETIVHFRPRVAVLLNVFPDHLDRYSNFDDYVAAKIKIFMNQTADDHAVLNADRRLARLPLLAARAQWFSLRSAAEACLRNDWMCLGDERWLARSEVRLPGEHNVANLLAAALAASIAGVGSEVMRSAAREFRGVPHRLELVAEVDGVQFVNDSQGTTPIATIAGLNAFDAPIVLIAGGQAKVNDFTELGAAIARRAHALVLIGRDARLIEDAARARSFTAIHHAATLPDAAQLAARLCPSPGVVLLSPACASFDMFRDYEQRGEVFREAAQKCARRLRKS